jgi:hypothetical protein
MPGPVRTGASTVDIRSLTADHRQDLAGFSCRRPLEPWTGVIEEMVQEHLADALENGDVNDTGV